MTQTSEKVTVGVDISKDVFDVAFSKSGLQGPLQFENNQVGIKRFQRWMKKHKINEAHVCMEATGRYADQLARALYEHGYDISVVNPRRIKAYADSKLRRNKTDALDAKLIEDFCRTQLPPLWQPPTAEMEALQMMTRRLVSLKNMHTQEENRLKSGITEPFVLKGLKKHCHFLEKEMEALEKQIKEHINTHAALKAINDLLLTIKGIGDTTAAILIAEIQDIGAFDSAPELAAYAGLSPRIRRSGSSVRGKSTMSKIGNAHIRSALYFPALSAKQHNPIVKAFSERLEACGKERMVVVGAAMRKLLHIVYGVWKNGQPFDPFYGQT